MKSTKANSKKKRATKPAKSPGKNVVVRLGERSYDVVIGSGVIDQLGPVLTTALEKRRSKGDMLPISKRAMIIADERLTDARARTLASLKSAGWEANEIPVAAGEPLKELDAVYPLYGELLKLKADRHSTLVALGGGSVGDAAGFIASTYMRGLSWVGLPTTLLAQVDSSVGGKTAVNHAAGKNLIGTFHQPALVLCETDFLKTLSRREVVSGLGEIIKYGLITDQKFFEYVRSNWQKALALDPEVMSRMIQVSLQWKAKTVAKDEFDRTGVRETLNFGHTFGHALESVTRYETYQHGEAVLWGMRFATALSKVRRKLGVRAFRDVDSFLRELPLEPLPQGAGPDDYFTRMTKDKKVREGKVRFVLLKAIGEAVLDREITEEDLRAAWREMQ